MPALDADRYLQRIDVDPQSVGDPDRETLTRLQSAHARAVPFETLAITGDPHANGDVEGTTGYAGEPIDLDLPALYEKIVERERGGFCYELNGCFAWLLEELGFEVRRCAARVAAEDGGYGVPADHLTLVVDPPDSGRVLVDVGVGAPVVRRPVPLDGSVVDSGVGVEWRLVESDRPDADYRLAYRNEPAGETDWTDRYILRDESRELTFFAASCEYHSTAPDSHFTGEPIAMRPTEDGHVSLSPETLTRTVRGESEKRSIDSAEYEQLLAETIGIELDPT
ncbi:arylamine N-acetyltransferase [Salinarchaeum chitinilyticum]